jgi:hypothetical protein
LTNYVTLASPEGAIAISGCSWVRVFAGTACRPIGMSLAHRGN